MPEKRILVLHCPCGQKINIGDAGVGSYNVGQVMDAATNCFWQPAIVSGYDRLAPKRSKSMLLRLQRSSNRRPLAGCIFHPFYRGK